MYDILSTIMNKQILQSIPRTSGVYIFKDSTGKVIYIGKAKSLRSRVTSYFKKTTNWKGDILRDEVADIATITTQNEIEALLLEAQLIKEHQPKFNVLLKTGQPFVYILFTQETLPRILLVRNKKLTGTYFGPFLHKTDARQAYTYLLTTFKLKLCNKKIANGCLDYHLGLCPGACMPTFNTDDYMLNLELAKHALQGSERAFTHTIKQHIEVYNTHHAFEKARTLAQYLTHFHTIFATLRTKFSETKYEHTSTYATAPVIAHKAAGPAVTAQLQALLRLDSPPKTIDCFDISHFQGHALVGSCIRFVDGVPDKKKFRHFKIKTLIQQNDYAALHEIVSRRYKDNDLPDLILIDGGKGQLSCVKDIVPVPLISLAKKEETIFSHTYPNGYVLDQQNDAARLLLALRDYTHHFAVSYHKKLRHKTFLKN